MHEQRSASGTRYFIGAVDPASREFIVGCALWYGTGIIMGRPPLEKFIEIFYLCRYILLFRTFWSMHSKKISNLSYRHTYTHSALLLQRNECAHHTIQFHPGWLVWSQVSSFAGAICCSLEEWQWGLCEILSIGFAFPLSHAEGHGHWTRFPVPAADYDDGDGKDVQRYIVCRPAG